MLSKTKDVTTPLVVTGSSVISGSIVNDVVVQKHSSLHLCGDLTGELTIEQGAKVVVEGTVYGKVINRGGRLVVNNGEGLAEFVSFDGPPEIEAKGVLKINLAALMYNWDVLAKQTSGECAATVRGDAYGCGIELIAAALTKFGCKTFFVSDLPEARRVRRIAPQSAIYVLNGFYHGTGELFAEIDAQPVISSAIEMADWDAFVTSSQWRGGFALHVSTGMDRLAMSIEEAAAFAPRAHAMSHGITLLMSDLDCPTDQAANDLQIKRFRELRRLYPSVPASLADSSGIFHCPKANFELVRSGPLFYGVNPTPGASNPMLPVIDLQARILQIHNLAPGETFAGNDGWVVNRRTRLAVVSVGYADGYPRPGNNAKLYVIVGGRRCPVVGRASMDWLAIDVTELPDPRMARRGEMVTLIGADISLDDFAAGAQSTVSEVLVNLGPRFRRAYHAG